LLKFPEDNYQGGIDFTEDDDDDDDEIEDMDPMETHFNLPVSLTELQKKLLGITPHLNNALTPFLHQGI